MNYKQQIIIVLLFLTTSFITAANNISQAQLQKLLLEQNKLILIDVRTVNEFSSGHIPGAINIPHSQLAKRLNELTGMQESQIVLYCKTGTRANIAKKILTKKGYKNLDHLIGDYSAWKKNKLPIEGDKNNTPTVGNPCSIR